MDAIVHIHANLMRGLSHIPTISRDSIHYILPSQHRYLYRTKELAILATFASISLYISLKTNKCFLCTTFELVETGGSQAEGNTDKVVSLGKLVELQYAINSTLVMAALMNQQATISEKLFATHHRLKSAGEDTVAS